MRRRTAFTLIELLVVIAVIAILAAIIFPVMASARRRGRTATCASNLRQIGMAFQMYSQDANEFYPYALDPTDKFTPQIWYDFFQRHPELRPPGITSINAWLGSLPMIHDVLQPYMKSAKLWKCPNDFGLYYQDFTFEAFHARPSCFERYQTSYLFRTEIVFRKIRIDSFSRGAEVNVMFDASGAWHAGAPLAREADEVLQYAEGYQYNVLYGDLHVKAATYEQLAEAWATPLFEGWTR